MMLVGAGARLLIFDQKFGEGRATTDLDVAVSIDSWEIYDKLHESLTTGDSQRFKPTNNTHRLVHIETNVSLDIVPFGKIGGPAQEIIFPDSGNTMNILGFSEALAHSQKIVILDELEVSIINIPAFIVLKLFAWGDRRERTNKDLEDIEFVLLKYKDNERVYSELIDEISDEVVDFLDADIYLLGQDICKLFQHSTLRKVNSILSDLIQCQDNEDPISLGYKLSILQQGMCSISTGGG